MVDRKVVTRFAPSPTGYLHIGGARTALFNWAFARHHGGTFILRLEDTDAVRSSVEAARAIVEDMRWLGMLWDEGPEPGSDDPFTNQIGDFGPYCQSQRLDLYNEHCERLLKSDKAFEDQGAVRFRMPRRDIAVQDLVLGEVTTPADKIEDLVIRKSDGFPTFHFANVIDDATMGVTHVIRAQEHLNNTHKHLALFEALEWHPPRYAHIPLIFNPDGSKMSKRDKAKAARAAAAKENRGELVGRILQEHDRVKLLTPKDNESPLSLDAATIIAFLEGKSDDPNVVGAIAYVLKVQLPEIDVRDFRRSGYFAETVTNYIALLGWSPGSDVERFDIEFLQREFSLDRVGKANARFDRSKLAHFSAQDITSLSSEEWRHRLYHFPSNLVRGAFTGENDPKFALFAEAYQQRSRTLRDPERDGRFLLLKHSDVEYDAAAVEKVLAKNCDEGFAVLEDFRTVLERLVDWTPEAIEAVVKQFAEQRGVGMGKIAQPVRVAVSGGTVSPPLGLTLAILGRAATLRRIDLTLALRGGA